MNMQELEQQLLRLDHAERQHLAELLNQSLSNPIPSDRSTPSSTTWNDGRTLSIATNTEAWNAALQKLQTPAQPQALADLLQSWEDEGDDQDQKETWELLSQSLDQHRLSNRPLFS